MVIKKAGPKYFFCSVCTCAYVVRAKSNRITLGPSPNHVSMCIIRLGFLLLEVFVCIDPLGNQIRR